MFSLPYIQAKRINGINVFIIKIKLDELSKVIFNFGKESEMIERNKLIEPEKVSCEVCFKEIPLSEANSVKATDYIMYYCGLDCYEKWKNQEEESK